MSGQMKMDLIINSFQNTLYVSDFHLTPISENTPYTYNSEETLINNNHQDNIKTYYANNKGSFYNDCINTEFEHNWPIICKKDEVINSYSNIYDMGCKRSKRYHEYNKQFEFFCPLWLEHVNQEITFKIDIKNVESNTTLGSNALILRPGFNEYHNKFVQYIYNYMTDAGITEGNDDVINVNFKNNSATVTGLNVSTGILETKDYNNLIYNITNIERPLMEADNMIVQSFKNNSLICKQLFNFNLCFNIEDIFSANIVKLLYGKNVMVSVTVYIGEEEVSISDFYTDYDYIDRYVKLENAELEFKQNVFDYLHDNRYIEFINKNKFCQSICHWALCENPSYIFNVYEGFSGLTIEGNQDNMNIIINEHCYRNAPNTYLNHYEPGQNPCGWINIYDTYTWAEFNKYIRNADKYKKLGTFIDGSTNYINNVKYKEVPSFNNGDGLYFVGLYIKGNILSVILDTFIDNYLTIFNGMYLIQKDDLIILLSGDIDNFTFNKFYKNLCNSALVDNNLVLLQLKELMSNKIDPTIVMLNKSLKYVTTTGPHRKSTEIDYIKDNTSNYVLRYDGKIKPVFTTQPSTLYYKDYISDDENDSKLNDSVYSDFKYLNFEPLYPSLNYCAIKKLDSWTYNECPKVKVSEHNNNVSIYDNNYEYKWFNVSKCLILNPELSFNAQKLKNDNKTLDDIIIECLSNYYGIEDNSILLTLKKMYTCKNSWEYLNNKTTDDYLYRITMKLNAY